MKYPAIVILSVVVVYLVSHSVGQLCRDGYEKIGCFKRTASVMQDLIVNDRDVTHANYSGKPIDWVDYYGTLRSLSCRCYTKAKAEGYKFFAIGFYGECFAGRNEQQYANLTASTNRYSGDCVNGEYEICDTSTPYECTGMAHSEYVYLLNKEESK